jgi:hypothetical protein
MEPWYCTREQVKAAPDYKHTAIGNIKIDEKIAAASRSIEGLLLRRFYPERRTVSFKWPRKDTASYRELWLKANELISIETLTAGGTSIASDQYTLKRWDERAEPPYRYIELNTDATAAFADPTVVLGLYGYRNDETNVGTLAAQLGAASSSTASVTWNTARIGVGDLLHIDGERMFVTERTWVDSTQNLQTALTAQANNVTVAVTTGSAFSVEELILIDNEVMYVTSVAGNNLTVKRQWDGTVLAAHALNADIYTLTGVQLQRGVLGTVAAVHETNAVIYRFDYPSLINELAVAETVVALEQAQSGYAQQIGSGEMGRETRNLGLKDLRCRAMDAYGKVQRSEAI